VTGTWGAPGAVSGAASTGTGTGPAGAPSPLSAAVLSPLGDKHRVQEAKQSSNILKEEWYKVYLFPKENDIPIDTHTHTHTYSLSSHLFYIPISSPTLDPSASKAGRARAQSVASSPALPLSSAEQGQTVGASTAAAFSKPQPPHHLPCLFAISPVLQGCWGSRDSQSHSTSQVCCASTEEGRWSLSALGRVSNGGEGLRGGGRPIQDTVAKEVTVEVRGFPLEALRR
jgi:hypothetical protein